MLSQRTMLLLLPVSILCIITSIWCCEYELKRQTGVCKSLRELDEIKENSKWRIVYLKSDGNRNQTQLHASAFKNLLDVEKIRIIGLVNEIQAGAFHGLNKLQFISLENNSINSLEPGFFDGPTTSLLINNSKVKHLKSGIFKRMPSITNVSITWNHIMTIQAGIFNGTTIKDLDLSHNKIQFINNNAFTGMKQLEVLNLSSNDLTIFDTKLYLGYAPQLTQLDLRDNHLKSLSKDALANLKKLTYLYLQNNQLDTLTSNCFHDLESLRRLDISNNKLTEISPDLFPVEGMRTVQDLFLHENQLCFLSPEVLKRLPAVKYFSYGGNPWQCACWNVLDLWIRKNNIVGMCHDEYKAGKRPECIIIGDSLTECYYDLSKHIDTPQLFRNHTAHYQGKSQCNLYTNYI